MPHRFITQSAPLAEFCQSLQNVDYVTIDTEFIREKTYYPQLCLIQVAGPNSAYAIDPLADGIDLQPLYDLLANPAILKVFHAGRQDIEIFFLKTGRIPEPIFDTQIAAQACGYGESISYADLVSRTVKATVDKASRYTDWAKRPLTDRQILYALEDVTYLRMAYEALRAKLEQRNRMEWIAEEMAVLASPDTYQLAPEDAWRRLKTGNLKPKQLAVLREITAWRELEARKRDVPRNRILRDETLLEIAASLPHTEEQLRHIRGIGAHWSPKWVEILLGATEAALALPSSEWPHLAPSRRSTADSDLVALLQLLLKLISNEHHVSARLIAGKDELEAIAEGRRDCPALSGWRYELFGKHALELMAGNLSVRWDSHKRCATLQLSQNQA